MTRPPFAVAMLRHPGWLFLTIAFGSTAYLTGQVIGKMEMTLVALPLLLALRKARAA